MTIDEFYDNIEFNGQARIRAEQIQRTFETLFPPPYVEALFDGSRREEGLRELTAHLGEDADGMKMFVYMSHCALRTYERYRERGISRDIFFATMKFLSRFMAAEITRNHAIAFRWGWWFPRQLAMQEFRLGALEYEMSGGNIFMHIPSDADLSPLSVRRSVRDARLFFKTFYPEYAEAPMLCDSWLLSPALPALLPPTSNIVRFQREFEVLRWEKDSSAYLEWVYPVSDLPYGQLAEGTALQRAMKAYLLAGGKVGWALGRLRGNIFQEVRTENTL